MSPRERSPRERAAREPIAAPRARRWWDFFFRIRTLLLAIHMLLVVVPIAGVEFARVYERELLRSEEEGMRLVAVTLATTYGRALGPQDRVEPAAAMDAVRAAVAVLHGRIRVLDHEGRALADTMPEEVELYTRGRFLVGGLTRRIRVEDPIPEGGSYAARAEVKKALAGAPATFTRVIGQVRGVGLFFAQPIVSGGGQVRGVVYVSRTTYPVLVSLYRVRNGLVRVGVISLALAIALGSFLAFTIARPLAKLTEGANRIARGEKGVALKLSGRDELAELARAFDAMARELDARLEANAELAANVSHEFKTPIASIRGAAELLRDGAIDEPAARDRFLGNVLADADRLSRLVSRLLELSRVEASPEPPAPVDLRALLEDLVARHLAAGEEVRLDWRASRAHVLGNADHLDSLFGNLLDNAARFSPAGSPIELQVLDDAREGWLACAVIDRGAGVSEKNLARLGTRFFTTRRAEGGTGLGLALVRAVVEAHGGTWSVESKLGEGTTVRVRMPTRL
jgi:two-component system sensor histidine kinase ChvG